MKKSRYSVILFCIISLYSTQVTGQVNFYSSGDLDNNFVEIDTDYDKNVLKTNLTSAIFKNFELQYERMLSRKVSLTVSGRFQPYSEIAPISDLLPIDEESVKELKNISLSSKVFTSELRFYLGKKPGPRGFYIAPFARLFNYQVGVEKFEVDISEGEDPVFKELEFNGELKALTGGLMFGSQWRLGKNVYLDWWIIGLGVGKSSGKIEALINLNPEEQESTRESLNELEIPVIRYGIDVSDSGARLNFQGPFANLRGGLLLGFKF